MNPNYRVFVDICLAKPHHEGNIWMRLCKYLPFTPRVGDVLRVTEEGVDEPLDIVLTNVVYDTVDGHFLEEQTDERLVEEVADSGTCDDRAAVAYYTQYGFSRLNFPTGNGR